MPTLNSIQEILADLRAGKMVVIMDDEDRENEGDLLMAAECVTAKDINFMARFGRGLICLTLTREHCRELRLPLMVSSTDAEHTTNFTVSIEAAEGVTTGISAHDRALTVQAAVKPGARAEDLRQPGHIFPLMAQPGGVLTRAGHTEAGCDFARLAGFQPASVIVEIMNEDGTMARRPDLEVFAREHGLKIGTIADLIRHRLEVEPSVERLVERPITTAHGDFKLVVYEDQMQRHVHLALIKGDLTGEKPPLVRVHLLDTLRDIVGAQLQFGGWSLDQALARVAADGTGVVVLLRGGETSRDLLDAVATLSPSGQRAPRAGAGAQAGSVLRTYGVGARILRDLGVHRMRVLSAPKQMHGLSAFGLEVTEYVDSALAGKAERNGEK
jgi:3,4-dihydroxy 2-butanone 4-phosphate synthase/GTP cyclohydrolase II